MFSWTIMTRGTEWY